MLPMRLIVDCAQVNDTLSDELVGLSGVEAEYQATALTASLPVKIGIGVPSPARLATIVETSPIPPCYSHHRAA